MDIIVRAWNPEKEEYVKETKEGITIDGKLFSHGDFFTQLLGLPKEEVSKLEFELALNKRDENKKMIFENDIVEITDGAISSYVETEGGEIVREIFKNTYKVFREEVYFFIELVDPKNDFGSPLAFSFPVGRGVSYKVVGNSREGIFE